MEIFKSICLLLAGVSVFLLGIKLMSTGLQTGAGKSVKKIFTKLGDNRFIGCGVGIGATVTIQSSTAVTVMVVGFVNAGIMTMYQAAAVIMGANIGTTLTAFLGTLGGLPIASVFMATGVIGIFMYMFAKKKSINIAGQIITGLAIIFVGMNLMSSAFKSSKELSNLITDAFVTFSSHPLGPLLLFLIGTLFTATIQSSTATTVMIVTMAIDGIISPYVALFVVLGANLGTCFTTLIASIGTTPNAKRAALIHLSTDIFGFIVFLPLLWIFGEPIANGLVSMSGGNKGLAVSFAHLFYNMIMIGILIWFIGPLIKLTHIIIKTKGEEIEEPRLYFIDESPNIKQCLDEATHMIKLSRQNLNLIFPTLLGEENPDKNKITNIEQRINYIEKGIGRALVKLSKHAKKASDKEVIRELHHLVSDGERIGDRAFDFVKMREEMLDNKIEFSETATTELKNLFGTIEKMFDCLDDFKKITELKKQVALIKHEIKTNHIMRLHEEKCSVEKGSFYFDTIAMLERIADLIVNIAVSFKTVL